MHAASTRLQHAPLVLERKVPVNVACSGLHRAAPTVCNLGSGSVKPQSCNAATVSETQKHAC